PTQFSYYLDFIVDEANSVREKYQANRNSLRRKDPNSGSCSKSSAFHSGHMKLFHVVFSAGIIFSCEGLRRVYVKSISHSLPIFQRLQEEDSASSLTEHAQTTNKIYEVLELDHKTFQESGNGATIIDEKKKALEGEISVSSTTEAVMTFEPIYDKPSDVSYSEHELLQLCNDAKNTGKKFGISDMTSFADNNCSLIQLYYTDVTCEQINTFMQYCQSTGAFH
ncbi:hypothetical protein DICVIV_12608, partial [Dictyocaulus viviparus]